MVIFNGRFVIYLRNDNLALFCVLLLACENKVAIEDACVNHGITFDAECEDIGTAGQEVAIDSDCPFEVLDGENRLARSDSTYDWDFNCVVRSRSFGFFCVRRENFYPATEPRGTVDIAFFD